MKEHWRRDAPQFFNIYALDWERGVGPELTHGVESRLVSKDDDTGAATIMVRIPPRWRYTERANDGTLEIFVLDGDLTADGQTVGATGFVAVPKGCGPVELSSQAGCQAYVFSEPVFAVDYYYDGGQLQVRKIWDEPWTPSVMPGVQHGIMHKSMRIPDPHGGLVHGGPSGMLRFILMAPGFGERRQEVHHDCWEEMIWLWGDFLMPQRGLHAAGSLLANPPNLKHGPLLTAKGNVQILHCNAPMGADFQEVPGGREVEERFQDTTSWLDDPVHKPWSELPDLHAGELDTRELEYTHSP